MALAAARISREAPGRIGPLWTFLFKYGPPRWTEYVLRNWSGQRLVIDQEDLLPFRSGSGVESRYIALVLRCLFQCVHIRFRVLSAQSPCGPRGGRHLSRRCCSRDLVNPVQSCATC